MSIIRRASASEGTNSLQLRGMGGFPHSKLVVLLGLVEEEDGGSKYGQEHKICNGSLMQVLPEMNSLTKEAERFRLEYPLKRSEVNNEELADQRTRDGQAEHFIPEVS